MLDGVIAQKLQSLDQVLAELRSLGQVDGAQLRDDWRTRRAVERDLQVLVEIVVDICQRPVLLAGQAPAATSVDAIERCIQLGALSDNDAYRNMVRFRNLLVQRYEHIDLDILVTIVNHRLADFGRFRSEILTYVRDH